MIFRFEETCQTLDTEWMPLHDETRQAIHDYLLAELTRYVRDNVNAGEALATKPFHARLLPTLFNVAMSENLFTIF